MNRSANRGRVTCIVLILGLTVGCGSAHDGRPKVVPARGQVLYNGQTVAGAVVTFSPQPASPAKEPSKSSQIAAAVGTTDEQGRFTLMTFKPRDGAVPGTYRVLITKLQKTAEVPPLQQLFDNPKLADDFRKSGGGYRSLLPKKYSAPDTSGLTATVTEAGKNDFRFELKD